MRRIALDFSKTQEQVITEIRQYIPEVTAKQVANWEKDNLLECKFINGEKLYFRNAVANLFRVDSGAKAIKERIKPTQLSAREKVNQKDIPQIVSAVKLSGNNLQQPIKMRLTYTLTVHPNVVPEGRIVRCWLPYPRRDIQRQKKVKLISVNADTYTVSPSDAVHSSLYMEKEAIKDSSLIFKEVVEFTSFAAYYPLKCNDSKSYLKQTDAYKKYTAEKLPHILFSDTIKRLAKQIVGKETCPLLQARKLFVWIDHHFPWASAREYSTISCIPAYVLENKHGDCGQVTLLFITLARSLGIPVRFQSGLMLHPKGTNIHDWASLYFEGVGWVPMDQSFGLFNSGKNEDETYFFTHGIDAYRMVVNQGISGNFVPSKNHPRSEIVDFQRGEVEWEGGNLYFDQWSWNFKVEYLKK